jgi:DNA repair protein RadC
MAEAMGHRARLRDKYLALGLEALTDEEVVELLLTLATPRKDCKPLAREAVKRFGGLRGVLSASAEDLGQVPGLGPVNTLPLRLVHDTARRFLRAKLTGRDFLRSARECFDYLHYALRDRKTEAVAVLYLNAQNAVLAVEEPFEGGAAGSQVDVQVILRRALALGATQFVCAHNHPSGLPQPSPGDLRVTRELILAARAVGLKLVDHLIVGDNTYFSFSEAGQLARIEDEVEVFRRQRG